MHMYIMYEMQLGISLTTPQIFGGAPSLLALLIYTWHVISIVLYALTTISYEYLNIRTYICTYIATYVYVCKHFKE